MAIPFVDEEKKKMRVMGQPKVYDPYAEGTPTFEAQKKQPDGIAPLVKPVVEGMAGAAGAVKSGADAFSGAMINNPIAKGVGAITGKIASDSQAQQAATDTYERKKMREGLVKQFPEGRQLFSNMPVKPTAENSPELFVPGQIKANAPVPAQPGVLGVAPVVPDRQFGIGMQAGSGRITLSETGESVSIDGSGNIQKFDASGKPIDALTKRITSTLGNPNTITSNSGLTTTFQPGTDPALMSRYASLSNQMDKGATDPTAQANLAKQKEQFMARNNIVTPDPMADGLRRLSPGRRAEVETARMGLANAKAIAEGQQKIGMAGVENAKANTEINRMNAESTGRVQTVDAEGKKFTLDKQKEVDALTKQRMTATPEEIIKIDSQLEAMGALKREKPTVHFANTYDANGMITGQEPYVFDPRTMGVTKPGGGKGWEMEEIEKNPAYLKAYNEADPKRKQEILAKMRERRAVAQ